MLEQIQDRLSALIAAHAYFVGSEVITQKAGDIDTAVESAIARLGFVAEVTVASGNNKTAAGQSSRSKIHSAEVIKVSVIHNPTLKPEKNILLGVEAVLAAVHGQPLVANSRGSEWFEYLGHDPVPNPDGHAEHAVIFRINSHLATSYTEPTGPA
jgi:hypothetical protein